MEYISKITLALNKHSSLKTIFFKYKKEFEDNNFVKLRFRNSKKGITRYRCNRSPCFKTESVSTGIRFMKKVLKEGPSQISHVCTAGLIKTVKDGCIFVKAYPSHSNHDIDDRHKKCLNLPESSKTDISNKFLMGVKLSVINKEINKTCKEQYPLCIDDPSVTQLRASYDNLLYIKNTLVDDKVRLHKEDCQSVELLVKKYPNDIIYYKSQYTLVSEYPVSKIIFLFYLVKICNICV